MKQENSDYPIYVLNYQPIRNAINDNKALAKSVANYKEGGLSTFFRGCDEATSFNPQYDYEWASYSAKSNLENCVTKIETALSHINAEKKSDVYTSLRNEMLNAHSSYSVDGTKQSTSAKDDYHSEGDFTTSSYNTFKGKYRTAMDEMERLVKNPYKTTLGSVVT